MTRKKCYHKLKQCRPFQHGTSVPLWEEYAIRFVPIQDVIGKLVVIRNARGGIEGKNPRIPQTCNAALVEMVLSTKGNSIQLWIIK